MTARQSLISSATAALLGALLSEAINLLASPDEQSITRHVTSVTLGAIIGWLYDLGRQTSLLLQSATNSLELIAGKLDLQDAALDMLLAAGAYGEIVRLLLSDSVSRGFKTISFCDENRYFRYLARALDVCETFQTIHRKPISMSWGESDAAPYLQKLRDRSMHSKTRVFVIDQDDLAQMERDLGDPDTMARYWARTGSGMRTFWVSSNDYQAAYRNLPLPPDCVMFDSRLIIAFDAGSRTVSFDLVDGDNSAQIFFGALSEQLENQAREIFSEVPNTDSGPAS